MSNLIVRSITGALFVAALIGAILWDPIAVAAVFGLFMLLGVDEFARLVNQHTSYSMQRGFAVTIAVLAFAGFTAVLLGELDGTYLFLLFPLALVSLVSSLFRKSTTALQDTGLLFFSWLYILVPFLMILHLAFIVKNPWEFVGMFVLIWSNDTFAYVCGRLFGRTKLFERISPKKTWEGTIGGIVFALIAGWCWATWVSELNEPYLFWLIVAPFIALGAIFGDLFESQLKRQIGVKDSGNILPGHGGILDRFDAALMAIPFFYGFWMVCC